MLHKPVLFNEVIEYLRPQAGGCYLDCTVGLGGHARGILERIGPQGLLVGLDQDRDALREADLNLRQVGSNFKLFYANFVDMDVVARESGVKEFDGILMDLGVSSLQLDTPERGFSFNNDGRLDMRMDKEQTLTAAHIVNRYSEDDLREIFSKYGQEWEAKSIVANIVAARRKAPITSTVELSEIIKRAKRKRHYERVNPATKSFQALRIATNDELGVLDTGLGKAVGLLKGGARLCVISFHSLEDRIVKFFFKNNDRLKILTKKPVEAAESETEDNRRSRSAKLRVAEKETLLHA